MHQIYFFIGFGVLMLVVKIISDRNAEKRQEGLFSLATELGLRFDPEPGDIHAKYEGFFKEFGHGNERRSSDQLSGRVNEIDWDIFDYSYSTGSGKEKNTFSVGVIVASVGIIFPEFAMRAERIMDRVGSILGGDEIKFESEQFSRMYHVTCVDRKFAYDLIHPKMIEYLLQTKPRNWEMRGRRIAITCDGKFKPDEIAEVMKLIEGFVALIPPYVRQDRAAVELP